MLYKRIFCAALAGTSLFLVNGVPAEAHRSSTQAVLSQIERGQWLLKERLGSERKICFTAPVNFIQIAHGNGPCDQFVISQDQHAATVSYSCDGHGKGRTTITVETPRLVKIETQGVLDGSPFEQEYEARRTGACS
ncbi:hypothetical protein P6144_17405 [Sphingomonas sp. HITSZ_GF]|uniref:hypothetical protein n=1 Tax=Sphingomonas sp. HITSZ_GF TaxID=3037247 RepID=UPI00240D245F|nr:hypothetical protein [Sphingomonas sp. HITSZ_GF]MDG2535442.1 hypothetical protein [Sphingomonas sp. HITSZ_GF]